MGELIDKVKGNVKESIGSAKEQSADPDVRAEGTAQKVEGKGDQLKGKVKGLLGDDI